MSQPIEIIAYRNPMEAMLWQTIMSGDMIPIALGAGAFLVMVVLLNNLMEKYIRRNRMKSYSWKAPTLLVDYGQAAIWIASFATAIVVAKMFWLP